MIQKHPERLFFVVLFVLAILLFGALLVPVFTPLFLAIVCATLWYPLHVRIEKLFGSFSSVASLVSVLLVLLVVIVPVAFIGAQVATEAFGLYQYLGDPSSRALDAFSYNRVAGYFERFMSQDSFVSHIVSFEGIIRGIGEYAGNLFSYALSQAFSLGVGLFVFCFCLYYLLKDGPELKNAIISALPLSQGAGMAILLRLQRSIHAVFKGFLIVAIIQGILAGIGFWIAGIPQPVLWGVVAVAAALVPNVGTALIIVPSVAYSALFQSSWQTIFLIAWGVLVVGTADNVVRPMLTSRESGLHPFLIFLSIIGGVELFGIIGFIAGPVIVAFLYAVSDGVRQFRQSRKV